MTEPLTIRLNAGKLYAVDAPDAFSARENFDIELQNMGESVHVHLRFDEKLSQGARLPEVNHYVKADDNRRVSMKQQRQVKIKKHLTLKITQSSLVGGNGFEVRTALGPKLAGLLP